MSSSAEAQAVTGSSSFLEPEGLFTLVNPHL